MSGLWAVARLLWRLAAPTLLALLLAAAVAPGLFLGVSDVDAAGVRTEGDTSPRTPLERLAVSALFRAGALSLERQEWNDADPDRLGWRLVGVTPVLNCGRDHQTVALVVAEMHQRPLWRRNLEAALGRAAQQTVGAPPDWSYGIGQIRLSTAQAAIAAAAARVAPFAPGAFGVSTDAATVFEQLLDPCDNLRIAALEIDRLRAQGATDATLADRWRGAESAAAPPVIFTHAAVARAIEDALRDVVWRPSALVSLPRARIAPAPAPAADGSAPLLCLAVESDAQTTVDIVAFASPVGLAVAAAEAGREVDVMLDDFLGFPFDPRLPDLAEIAALLDETAVEQGGAVVRIAEDGVFGDRVWPPWARDDAPPEAGSPLARLFLAAGALSGMERLGLDVAARWGGLPREREAQGHGLGYGGCALTLAAPAGATDFPERVAALLAARMRGE